MNLDWWPHLVAMPIYFCVLLWIVSFFRKHPHLSVYFWAASLLTFPLWIVTGSVEGWFRWFKILSVLLPTIVVGLARVATHDDRVGRFWSTIRKPQFMWFFYGVLFLNIAEAVVKDVQLGNYFNALAGLFLCVTIPYVPRYWKIATSGGSDLLAYTTAGWNLLYTTWNACFVYAESPVYFASSLCILLAAELYPVIKKRPELYVTARVYTLAAHLLLRATFDVFPGVMDSSTWFNADVLFWWGVINLVVAVPFLFWFTWQLDSGRAETSFRHGRTAAQADADAEVEARLGIAPGVGRSIRGGYPADVPAGEVRAGPASFWRRARPTHKSVWTSATGPQR